MKKTCFLFCALPLLLGVASCGNSLPNQEEVNAIKALLAKQGLSPVYTKMFTASFSQNYDVFFRQRGGLDQETRFYSYRGAGAFGCLYEVSQEAYQEAEALENPDFFDYLSRGTGSYELFQTATFLSYLYDAEEDEVNIVETLENIHYLQHLNAKFTAKDVQISNNLLGRDKIKEEYDHSQRFNGIIDKELLFQTITVRAFSDIFARTSLYDGQRSCETLDRIYFDVVRGLKDKSDSDLSAFISNNNIRVEEVEENTLVHFKIEDEALRANLDAHDIIPGDFEGTLTYEKESGKFDAFNYKILYMVDEKDTTTGNINTATMEFIAEGYSKNQRYEQDLYIDPNPVVYEDAEVFLEDVIDEVIPPSI